MKALTAYLPKDHPMHGKLKQGDTVHVQATVQSPDETMDGEMKDAHMLNLTHVEKVAPTLAKKGKKSPIEYLKEKQRERSK